MKLFNNREAAEEDREKNDVIFEVEPITLKEYEREPQNYGWHCMKCDQDWKSFEAFLYDGCSPVYGNGMMRRLEGTW